jgi:hypothetical protein
LIYGDIFQHASHEEIDEFADAENKYLSWYKNPTQRH